jgi:ABC-2 type transport system permease protein
MKLIYRIARAELQTLFYSPIAWLILIIFTIQAGMAFCDVYEWQVSAQALAYKLKGVSMTIFAYPHMGTFRVIQQYLYLYIPLLTMGLMSRELSSGSIKLLYSSPITNAQIIIGKYLSMVFYALLLTAIMLVFVVYSAATIDHFDFLGVTSGLLGLFLLICTYASIGLFMSSLTAYQVVAAVGTLAILAVLNLVGSMWQDIAFVRDISYWLSIQGRSDQFINGLVCSEDVLYFIIVTALFLSFSILRMKAIRQKTPFRTSVGKYIGVSLIAVLLGYFSSRPAMMVYWDATRTNINTLTPNSQKIVAQMKGGLTINTYNNILDKYYYLALPKGELRDIERFSMYTRFKPEITMKYFRYYAKANNPKLDERYPKLSDKERMLEYAKVYKLDSSIFMSPAAINKIEKLKPEGYRFVRTLVRDNGDKTFLRVFDDRMTVPSEAEITAAFKRLVMELPQIGFVTGQGERDCEKGGDREYSIFAQERTFRYSLLNQGFDYCKIDLDKEIPQSVDILVIADMAKALTPEQQANLNKYIDRGGNLLVAGEPGRQEYMNPLAEKFGVQFMPETLTTVSENFPPEFIQAQPTAEGSEMIYQIGEMRSEKYIVTMPGVNGLKYSTDKGYKVTPLIVKDTLADSVTMAPPVPVVIALDRKIGDKEQKIIVMGDADCISNAEISIGRKDVNAANYNLIMGAFYWMSNDEVPIDVRRPTPPDDKISMGVKGMTITRWGLVGIIPFLMAFAYVILWIRRKSR